MKKRFTVMIILASTLSVLVGQSEKLPLKNDDVLRLVKEGLAEQTIVLMIQNSPGKYDTSPDAILALNKAHVPPKILDAMLTRNQPQLPTEEQLHGQAAVSSMGAIMGEVYYIDATNRIAMVQSKGEQKMVNTFVGFNSHIEFEGSQAALRIKKGEPEFELTLRSNVVPGEHVGLLRPKVVKNRHREIPTGGIVMFAQTGPDKKKLYVPLGFSEVRKDASSMGEITVYRMKAAAPLPAGEYVIDSSGQYYCFGIDP